MKKSISRSTQFFSGIILLLLTLVCPNAFAFFTVDNPVGNQAADFGMYLSGNCDNGTYITVDDWGLNLTPHPPVCVNGRYSGYFNIPNPYGMTELDIVETEQRSNAQIASTNVELTWKLSQFSVTSPKSSTILSPGNLYAAGTCDPNTGVSVKYLQTTIYSGCVNGQWSTTVSVPSGVERLELDIDEFLPPDLLTNERKVFLATANTTVGPILTVDSIIPRISWSNVRISGKTDPATFQIAYSVNGGELASDDIYVDPSGTYQLDISLPNNLETSTIQLFAEDMDGHILATKSTSVRIAPHFAPLSATIAKNDFLQVSCQGQNNTIVQVTGIHTPRPGSTRLNFATTNTCWGTGVGCLVNYYYTDGFGGSITSGNLENAFSSDSQLTMYFGSMFHLPGVRAVSTPFAGSSNAPAFDLEIMKGGSRLESVHQCSIGYLPFCSYIKARLDLFAQDRIPEDSSPVNSSMAYLQKLLTKNHCE